MDYDLREFLNPPRCTIAMWDYSWLYCHHPGGSFEDWPKVLKELAERGFNTVRIDAFPLLIGQLHSPDEEVTVLAEPRAAWGPCPHDVRHRILPELLEFLRLCREHGIFVILSAWNLIRTAEYPELRATYAASRERFREAWEKVLDAVLSAGLAENILYVDLDQEFPFFSPYASELSALGAAKEAPGGDAMAEAGRQRRRRWNALEWNDSQMEYVYELLTGMLSHFQRRYPGLRFTYSFTGFREELRTLNLRQLDVLELHFWIHGVRFDSRTGFYEIPKERGVRRDPEYQKRIDATMRAIRPMLIQEMRNQLAFARDWAREIAAPLVTTEAWGPWWHMDEEGLEWQWLYDWCEECMAMAGEFQFWGATPWNYAHPYWKNWEQTAWYQRVNRGFSGDIRLT